MSSVMRFDEWQDSDGNPVFNGAGGVSPGGLIAVKSAIFTGAQVESSIAPGANFAVTDLSITHEVADASNKLIITGFIGVLATNGGNMRAGIAVHDGTNLIGVADADGSFIRAGAGGSSSGELSAFRFPTVSSVTFLHTPGAGSKTYTLRAVNGENAQRTLFINRQEDEAIPADRIRGASSLVIQEVTV